MKGTDKAVDLLAAIRGLNGKNKKNQGGLKVIKVQTTEPDPITFTFEGSDLALDLEIFEIPVGRYPLRRNDRLLVYPIVGDENSQRWAAIEKISGGAITMATMASGSSLKISGIEKTYSSSELIIPPYFSVSNASSIYTDSYTGKASDDYLKKAAIQPLKAGDLVSIAPVLDGDVIKYVILERY